jgi:hypothetical protein
MQPRSSRGLRALAGVLAVCAPVVAHPSATDGHGPDGRRAAASGAVLGDDSGAIRIPRVVADAGREHAREVRAPVDAPATPSGAASQIAGPGGVVRGAAPGPVQADAYGLNLDPLATCVSCTSARAGENSTGAEGRELRVAGESVSEGQVPANGYANGWLVAVPFNDAVRCAVAGWNGSTSANGESSRADARGALLDLDVGHGSLATLSLFDSASEAEYSDSSSRAHSSSDGARGGLGGGALRLVVLHSEGSSDGRGDTSLVSVDDVQLMRSARPAPDGIAVPGVTSVSLLHSDGSGGLVVSASDGRAQRVMTVGTTWVGSPSADPQPLQ